MAEQRYAPRRLPFADGFRAFAIFLVVASHLPLTLPHVDFDAWGRWGVNCFFVLSGFLLARPYLHALLDPTRRWPSARLFLLRRVLRIYPLYVVAVGMSCIFVLLAGGPAPHAADVGAHLLMLHGFSAAWVLSLNNGPLWTMPVDAAFYVSLPLFAFALSPLTRRLAPPGRVWAIAGALGAIAAAGVLARYAASRFIPSVEHSMLARALFVHNIVGMAPAFAIGVALAFVPLVREHRLPRYTMPFAIGFAALFAALLPHLNFGQASGSADLTRRIVFADLIAALSVGLTVLVVDRGPRVFAAALTSRWVASVAALAYAVYLFHYPVLLAVEHAFGSRHDTVAQLEETLLTLFVTLLLADVGHRWVEQPFLDLKDRKRERAPLDDTVALPLVPEPAGAAS